MPRSAAGRAPGTVYGKYSAGFLKIGIDRHRIDFGPSDFIIARIVPDFDVSDLTKRRVVAPVRAVAVEPTQIVVVPRYRPEYDVPHNLGRGFGIRRGGLGTARGGRRRLRGRAVGGGLRIAPGAAGRAAVVLAPAWSGPSSRRAGARAPRASRSTCASRSCTTPAWWASSKTAARCSSTSSTRCPTGPASCSPLMACCRRSDGGGPPRAGRGRCDLPAGRQSPREARRFAADRYTVALVGHAGHEEVEGTLGEGTERRVLCRPGRTRRSCGRGPGAGRLCDADHAGGRRGRGGSERAAGAVPRDARARQRRHLLCNDKPAGAVRAVADDSDFVLVAGSANSSNSHRLVETRGPPVRRPTPSTARRYPPRLVGRGSHDRRDRRSLRPACGRRGNRFGVLRAEAPADPSE